MRRLGAALIGAALLLAFSASLPAGSPDVLGPSVARAASPQPSSGSGDTRTTGEAPGFVGSPLVAIGAVLGLGLLTGLATIGYVRLTGGPGRRTDDNSHAAR
jgi:hypothetical protein